MAYQYKPGYRKKPERRKFVSRSLIAKKKRNAFLRILAGNGGRVSDAAHAVGYSDTGVLRKYRKEDEEFAEAWDQAMEAAGDAVEAEAYRRAMDGTMEPVFYQGEIVGYKPTFSDTLLAMLLKKHRPDDYRDSRHGGGTSINFGIAVLPATATDDESWEKGAIEMHEGQEVIQIEAKPVEDTMKRAVVKRGD
jgi:hypothetical protein